MIINVCSICLGWDLPLNTTLVQARNMFAIPQKSGDGCFEFRCDNSSCRYLPQFVQILHSNIMYNIPVHMCIYIRWSKHTAQPLVEHHFLTPLTIFMNLHTMILLQRVNNLLLVYELQ